MSLRKSGKWAKLTLNPNETLETQNSLWNRSENANNRVQGKRLNCRKHYFCRAFSKKSPSRRSSVHQCALSPLSRAHRFWQMLRNPLKNHQKYAQEAQGTPKRPRRRKRYETVVKVPSTSTLWTRVRTTSVFSKSISKKRFSCEHVCKL